MLVPLLPRSSRRAHKIVAHPLLVSIVTTGYEHLPPLDVSVALNERALTLGMTLPLPEAPRTPAQDRLGSDASEVLLISQAERGGARVSLPPASNVPLATPLSAGCRGKCVFGSPRAHFSARVSDRCDSGQNKTHTFSKREQTSLSAYHKCPALMQPVCAAVSTFCLSGHPRCVRVGNDYGKIRLHSPIRSKTTALSAVCSPPQCAARTLKSSAQR